MIALTGDIFDSKIGKERKDKMFNSEATACQAYLHGRDLIVQFVEYIRASEIFGAIRIVGIGGNEAALRRPRSQPHHGRRQLGRPAQRRPRQPVHRRRRRGRVRREPVCRRVEWKVLLLHGDQGLDSKLSQTKVQSLLGTHGADFGIGGHIHDTMVLASGSAPLLVGTDFAGDGLGSRAVPPRTSSGWLLGSATPTRWTCRTPDPSIRRPVSSCSTTAPARSVLPTSCVDSKICLPSNSASYGRAVGERKLSVFVNLIGFYFFVTDQIIICACLKILAEHADPRTSSTPGPGT